MSHQTDAIIEQAREVLRIEAEGLLDLVERVGSEFAEAVDLIYHAKGRVVVTGIGKSGLVGRKIMATLNSTGTPAIFLHPVEAMHGDLGMVQPGDVVLALSNSGETVELNAIMGAVKSLKVRVIAMTGDPLSTLAGYSDVVLDSGVAREACPLGLAPTTSTTAALALGDALAVALINLRQFKSQDFKKLHPGGSLGDRLSVQVREVMISGPELPTAKKSDTLAEVVRIMDRFNLGVLLVIGPNRSLEGIFTDGDLRRMMVESGRIVDTTIDRVMTRDPITIAPDRLAAEALEIMQTHEITVLPIVNRNRKCQGMIHLHRLLGKGKFQFNQTSIKR